MKYTLAINGIIKADIDSDGEIYYPDTSVFKEADKIIAKNIQSIQ